MADNRRVRKKKQDRTDQSLIKLKIAAVIVLIGVIGCFIALRIMIANDRISENCRKLADTIISPVEELAETVRTPLMAADIEITEDYREGFVHGDKGPEFQKYIVLHDTEDNNDGQDIINWWDSNGNLVATHFIVNKDGKIYQCVPLDKIAHHAGYGDTGHNEQYDVADTSRDDMEGSGNPLPGAADYGMNSYSIGIEMVHVGGSGDYPEEQLESVDKLIAYIDSYYGFRSEIIDHKAWRTGNSDTSPEFAEYLKNYQTIRTHLPKSESQNPAMNFAGDYVCDRAKIHVEAADSNNGMKATVEWGGSAFDAAEWVMSGTFDAETLLFEYHDCVKTEYTYTDNGDVKSEEEVFVGGHGFMQFTEGDPLTLTWQEDQEKIADGMVFESVSPE